MNMFPDEIEWLIKDCEEVTIRNILRPELLGKLIKCYEESWEDDAETRDKAIAQGVTNAYFKLANIISKEYDMLWDEEMNDFWQKPKFDLPDLNNAFSKAGLAWYLELMGMIRRIDVQSDG